MSHPKAEAIAAKLGPRALQTLRWLRDVASGATRESHPALEAFRLVDRDSFGAARITELGRDVCAAADAADRASTQELF